MYSPPLIWVCIFAYVSASVFVQSFSANICQSKINRHKNTCYWVDTNSDTFNGGEQRCAANGGHLATIDSAETSDFLKEFFDAVGLTGGFWIGYDERNQKWNDGTLFSWTNYYGNEPNKESEYCTGLVVKVFGIEFGWVDGRCPNHYKGLCQIQVSPSRQFDFVGVEEGSAVSVGDHVVVVQSASRVSCGVQCVRDADCFVFRYIQMGKTCTIYNSGNSVKTVDRPGEWFLY